MKLPKKILLLIIIAGVSFASKIQLLFTYENSSEYAVFVASNQSLLFFVFLVVIIILNAAALRAFRKPEIRGFYTVLGAFSVSLLHSIVSYTMLLSNPQSAREGYVAARIARGAPIREEQFDMIFSETGIHVIGSTMILIFLVGGTITLLNKRFFTNQQN